MSVTKFSAAFAPVVASLCLVAVAAHADVVLTGTFTGTVVSAGVNGFSASDQVTGTVSVDLSDMTVQPFYPYAYIGGNSLSTPVTISATDIRSNTTFMSTSTNVAVAAANNDSWNGTSFWDLEFFSNISGGTYVTSRVEDYTSQSVQFLSTSNDIASTDFSLPSISNSTAYATIGDPNNPYASVYGNDNVYIRLNSFAVDLAGSGDSSSVSEPFTLALVGTGLVGLAGFRRRKAL